MSFTGFKVWEKWAPQDPKFLNLTSVCWRNKTNPFHKHVHVDFLKGIHRSLERKNSPFLLKKILTSGVSALINKSVLLTLRDHLWFVSCHDQSRFVTKSQREVFPQFAADSSARFCPICPAHNWLQSSSANRQTQIQTQQMISYF